MRLGGQCTIRYSQQHVATCVSHRVGIAMHDFINFEPIHEQYKRRTSATRKTIFFENNVHEPGGVLYISPPEERRNNWPTFEKFSAGAAASHAAGFVAGGNASHELPDTSKYYLPTTTPRRSDPAALSPAPIFRTGVLVDGFCVVLVWAVTTGLVRRLTQAEKSIEIRTPRMRGSAR